MCIQAIDDSVDDEKVIFKPLNTSKIQKMDSEHRLTMCRLCLHGNQVFVDVFQPNSNYCYTAAELITDLLAFQVQSQDSYPRVICSRCFEKLLDFKIFKEQCINSKSTYERLYKCTSDIIEINPPSVKIEPIDVSNDSFSSQMSFKSDKTHSEEISGNEVSTTQCSKKRKEESEAQRERRLQRQRLYYAEKKKNESLERRELRLSKMRESAIKRREKESLEERERRLSQLRNYAMKRIANETNEEREIRLKNMRTYAENRLANETLEQRQRRLGHAPFESKPSNVQIKRKPYTKRTSECNLMSNTMNQFDEQQSHFQEYLNHLGLGLVDHRLNQTYSYGIPMLDSSDKYSAPFPTSQSLHFAPSNPIEHLQPSGLHPDGHLRVENPPKDPQYIPEALNDVKQADSDSNSHQTQEQCVKKAVEVKMYEIL